MKKLIMSILIGAIFALSIGTVVAFAATMTSSTQSFTRTIGNTYSENYNYTDLYSTKVAYSKYTHNAKTRLDCYQNISDLSGAKMSVTSTLMAGSNETCKSEGQDYTPTGLGIGGNFAVEVNASNSISKANTQIIHKASVIQNGITYYNLTVTANK